MLVEKTCLRRIADAGVEADVRSRYMPLPCIHAPVARRATVVRNVSCASASDSLNGAHVARVGAAIFAF
jgi:hypothetical protein